MTALHKQELQQEIQVAIQKILDRTRAHGSLMTESTAHYMAKAAMLAFEVTADASREWEEQGYLKL